MRAAPDSAPLRLTSLPQVLLAHYNGFIPPYRSIYSDAVNGLLPASQKRGRWYWQRSDLQRIASVYELRPKRRTEAKQKAPTR